jgi:undecaprenyl-diphosphatase
MQLGKTVDAFDARVDNWFDDHLRGNPVADRVFYSASALGDHSLVWLILGAARGLRSERHFPAALRVGVGLGVESVLVNLGIKSVFRRARPLPTLATRPLHLRRPRTSSFPSGHATSAFTAAGLLAEDDVLWPAYYILALIVAWSRVHVKVHHASDVVVGIGIGMVLGRIGRRISPLTAGPAGVLHAADTDDADGVGTASESRLLHSS